MKHIYTAIILSVACCSVSVGAQERPDTVMSVTNPSSVTITENPEGFAVSVLTSGPDGESRSEYSEAFDKPVRIEAVRQRASLTIASSDDNSWDFTLGGPGIGLVNACGQPDGMGIEMGKSFEISWLNAIAVSYRMPWSTSRLSLGIGIDWRNYRISTSATRFIPVEGGGVGIGQYPEGVEAHGSRLKVFGIGMPLIWHQTLPFNIFGDKCLFGLGMVFNYNPHASMLTKWTTADGMKAKQSTDNIGHRRFTVDLIGLVRVWRSISLYVRYSPQTVLKGAGQPRFRPLSSGVVIYY